MNTRYANQFTTSRQGFIFNRAGKAVPHQAYIPSLSTVDGPLYNNERRMKNDELRELGVTGSRYRKMKKRERRVGA